MRFTKAQLVVSLLLCALIVTGCKRYFGIRLEASIGNGPAFSFQGIDFVPRQFRIVDFSVQKRQSNRWITIWQLNGTAGSDSGVVRRSTEWNESSHGSPAAV